MTLRITIICPENMIDDANQFALCVGNIMDDAQTFRSAGWEDAGGMKFALASLLSSDDFPLVASSSLNAPAHAPTADLAAAMRAQSVLETWSPLMSPLPPAPDPGKLLAIIGVEPRNVIPLLGLSPIPIEE
ncbi:hypothetical protein SAMN04488030_2542 [Aliiroseovarius halocynthiae]|uniref:Uncharacterized protein n=1 Tax=Aliiroseovarius halocynthiae TaxID=985055 RepID=A0A545SQ36_9RHOB|nr:hypothetical protein [Aliiroseovarius halocynthiae]TQV67078.1 hypothetical protein FIL88_10855 [Aliiroseovarius halocynthiae]SMR82199.1 hypothetical protein SAMN04488030_2542 [Aliiroseovarius halocynthiae]